MPRLVCLLGVGRICCQPRFRVTDSGFLVQEIVFNFVYNTVPSESQCNTSCFCRQVCLSAWFWVAFSKALRAHHFAIISPRNRSLLYCSFHLYARTCLISRRSPRSHFGFIHTTQQNRPTQLDICFSIQLLWTLIWASWPEAHQTARV